ncbi:MAG: MBL fold metallo-hydrolase [Clostridia bacterium]|nr:MBL fold metallo-hydrolase [Clostridia bacterium]
MARRKKISKKNLLVIIISAIAVIIISILGLSDKTDELNDYAAPDKNTENTVSSNKDNNEKIMTAHFIDVGQGDCTLFISGNETMLIDCGEAEYSDTVINDLKFYGVTELDYAVITHAHTDHMGGMANILDTVPTENIIFSEPSEKSSGTKSYGEFLDAADRCGADIIIAEPDYTFSFGNAECRILAPFEVSEKEENDNSVVMHITAGTTSFLMTGDAEKAVEKDIIEHYPNLSATILKVGHHGSKTSSHDDFISMLDCETAVIPVGEDNRYGHPTEQVIKTLESNNIECYRTDLEGTVTIECFTENYKIYTER